MHYNIHDLEVRSQLVICLLNCSPEIISSNMKVRQFGRMLMNHECNACCMLFGLFGAVLKVSIRPNQPLNPTYLMEKGQGLI